MNVPQPFDRPLGLRPTRSGRRFGSFTLPSFSLDLRNGSIRSQRGDRVGTFARTDTGIPVYVQDFEDLLKPTLANEVRFKWLRRVHNVTANPENPAAWPAVNTGDGTVPVATANAGIAPDGSNTAIRITGSITNEQSNSNESAFHLANTLSITTGIGTIWVKSNTGAVQRIHMRTVASGYTHEVDSTWRRLTTVAGAAINGGEIIIGTRGGSFVAGRGGNVTVNSGAIDILVWHPQQERTLGQTNQNPSEYVSVGVLASPYHGANVDGVKYFEWQNGNTVSNFEVTEATGAALTNPARGYWEEGTRNNICLQSKSFGNATWVKTRSTVTDDQAVGPDGTSTMDALIEDGTAANTHSMLQSITLTAATYCFSVFMKVASGTRRLGLFNAAANVGMAFDTDGTSVGAIYNPPIASGSINYGDGVYRVWMTFTGTAAASNHQLDLISGTALSYNGDSTSGYYLWGAQVELGGFPSSVIDTVAGAVTRNQDTLNFSSSGVVSAPDLTLFAEASFDAPAAQVSQEVLLSVSAGSYGTGDGALLRMGSSTTVSAGGNGSTANATTTFTATNRYSARFNTTGTLQAAVGNGGSITENSTLDWTGVGTTKINVGSLAPGGGQNHFGTIGRVEVFNKPQGDATLKGRSV